MKRASFLAPLSRAHHDHLVFATRLRRAARCGEDADAWADAVLNHYQRTLSLSFALEEQQVAPLLRDDAPRLAEQMCDEHAEIASLVTRIATATPRWEGLLEAFADRIVDHVRFEERVSFPLAERAAARRDAPRGKDPAVRPAPARSLPAPPTV